MKLLDLIVDAHLSFNIVDQPTLRILCESIAGRKLPWPSRQKLMLILEREFQKNKQALKDILKEQDFLCVTADVWTSHAQSYLGVTVHFLNDSYQRESYLLAFKQMKTRQTYDVLAKTLNDIFADYGIDTAKITNIVTDGGSAFCKMFKKYGEQIDAVVVDTNGEEILNADEELGNGMDIANAYLVDDCGDAYVSEILEFERQNINVTAVDESSNDVTFQNYFQEDVLEPPQAIVMNRIVMPPQRRCVSHLLNLLSQDFEKSLEGVAKAAFKNTFDTLHTLWSIIRNSARAKVICKDVLGVVLKFPCETRWNSRFDCVKQCNKAEIQSKLNELIVNLKSELNSSTSKQLKLLSTHNICVIQQYERVLEPVARSLDILQGDRTCHQGDIFPVLLSMKTHIARLTDSNNIIRDFKATLLKLIDVRFSSYFKYDASNKDFILAAVSLPRYKTSFIQNDEDKIFVKNLLISECKKIRYEKDDEIESVQNNDSLSVESDFIISFESSNLNRRNSIENSVETEVSQFLMDTNKENCMLNQYQSVRAIFFKYNTTLPSSAAVERVFSQSQMIFTPRRNRISSDNFEKTLMMKHNRMLINESHLKK